MFVGTQIVMYMSEVSTGEIVAKSSVFCLEKELVSCRWLRPGGIAREVSTLVILYEICCWEPVDGPGKSKLWVCVWILPAGQPWSSAEHRLGSVSLARRSFPDSQVRSSLSWEANRWLCWNYFSLHVNGTYALSFLKSFLHPCDC